MRKGIIFYLLSVVVSVMVFVLGIGIYHFWGKDFNFSVFKELEIFNMDVSSDNGEVSVIIINNANNKKLELNREILGSNFADIAELLGNHSQIINIGNTPLERYTNKVVGEGIDVAGFNFEILDNTIEINIFISQKQEEVLFIGGVNNQYMDALFILEEYLRPGGQITFESKAKILKESFDTWKKHYDTQEWLINEI